MNKLNADREHVLEVARTGEGDGVHHLQQRDNEHLALGILQ